MKQFILKKIFNYNAIKPSIEEGIQAAVQGDLKKLEELRCVHDSLFSFLKKDGYYLCKQDSSGKTPLMAAAENGHTEIMKWLISRYEVLTIDKQDNHGKTALITAIEHGWTQAVKLLLDKGARTDLADKTNKTAMMHAEETSPRYIAPIIAAAEKSREETKKVIKQMSDAADTMGSHGWD